MSSLLLTKKGLTEDVKPVAVALARHGLDICHVFSTQWYNDQLDREEEHLATSLRRLPLGKALLIGNTKAFWPCFLKWLKEQQQQAAGGSHDGSMLLPENPVDTYTTQVVTRVVNDDKHESNLPHPPQIIFWDHDWRPEYMVSMLRVAAVSGLCFLHPTAHLAIHPIVGPWLSLRAIVVYNDNDNGCNNHATTTTTSTTTESLAPFLANPLTIEQDAVVQRAAQRAFQQHDGQEWSASNNNNDPYAAAQPWIQLRDSVPLGREYRYSDDQIMYHYTKDIQILENILQKEAS